MYTDVYFISVIPINEGKSSWERENKFFFHYRQHIPQKKPSSKLKKSFILHV